MEVVWGRVAALRMRTIRLWYSLAYRELVVVWKNNLAKTIDLEALINRLNVMIKKRVLTQFTITATLLASDVLPLFLSILSWL
jgi:hypothetical protein